MRKVLILIVVICSQHAKAQQWPSELWHEGKIILITGDTLKGLVKYDFQQDVVQFNDHKNVVEAYSPRKVLFFEIFDTTVNQYRSFFVLPYAATGNYKTPIFFELLAEGKLTLLAREFLEYRTYSSVYYYGSYTRLVLAYKFFIMDETGSIVEFIGKKNDLLQLMGRRSNEVDQYIKSNKLKIEDRSDFTKIVAFYNSFFQS